MANKAYSYALDSGVEKIDKSLSEKDSFSDRYLHLTKEQQTLIHEIRSFCLNDESKVKSIEELQMYQTLVISEKLMIQRASNGFTVYLRENDKIITSIPMSYNSVIVWVKYKKRYLTKQHNLSVIPTVLISHNIDYVK